VRRIGDAAIPDGFPGGAATAAYQIEGAYDADGRGNVRAHSGKIERRDRRRRLRPLHRYRDDVALMADLGLTAYRFSIAWPRVIPREPAPRAQGLISTTDWSCAFRSATSRRS
jgi:beta-glucosidase/6-phospho-beta-glucosidase/beta-galactosidase